MQLLSNVSLSGALWPVGVAKEVEASARAVGEASTHAQSRRLGEMAVGVGVVVAAVVGVGVAAVAAVVAPGGSGMAATAVAAAVVAAVVALSAERGDWGSYQACERRLRAGGARRLRRVTGSLGRFAVADGLGRRSSIRAIIGGSSEG